MKRRLLLIAIAFAIISFAKWIDVRIGFPIFGTAIGVGFWIFIVREVWLSRPDGVNDFRYNLATAIIFLFFAVFAVMTLIPVYQAIAAKMG